MNLLLLDIDAHSPMTHISRWSLWLTILIGSTMLAGSVVAQTETTLYRYDDGDGDTNQGPPSTFDPDMLWGNYFLTEDGANVITEIQVAFGPTFPSLGDGPVTFWLLDDPDADLDPRNAVSVASVQATPDVSNDTLFTVEIPATQVGEAFFVGASALLEGGEDRPARVDTDYPGDRSWFFYAPNIAEVIDDLASAPFGTRMDNPEFVIFPGAFMIRAVGLSGPVSAERIETVGPLMLSAPVPNPTAGRVTLSYTLPEARHVALAVYDAVGRQVVVIDEGMRAAGSYDVTWEASALAPGAYVVRLQAEEEAQVRRITVLP